MERREFIKSSLFASLLTASGLGAGEQTPRREADYGAAYLKRVLDVLRGIEKHETPKLIQSAIRASELYKAGGRLQAHIIWGHSPIYETRSTRRGNPNILPQWGWDVTAAEYARLDKGDFYFSNDVSEHIRQAFKRGTYIVGVSVPYLPNEHTPRENMATNTIRYNLEDVSNITLYSHVPYQDGLVKFPEYPMVPLCPGSAISQICYYWMMSAEISYQIRERRKYPFISKAREYLIHVINLLHDTHDQLDRMKEAARQIAENIGFGGSLYIYDKANTLTSEACGRASGLMMTKALDINQLGKHDSVIFGSEISNDTDDLQLIQQIKDKEAYIVSISPFGTDGVELGERLYKYADVSLNNLAGESDGVVQVLKNEPRICPASGVMNIILLWAFTATLVQEMIRQGLVPYIKMGLHLKGGREYNDAIWPFYSARGF